MNLQTWILTYNLPKGWNCYPTCVNALCYTQIITGGILKSKICYIIENDMYVESMDHLIMLGEICAAFYQHSGLLARLIDESL